MTWASAWAQAQTFLGIATVTTLLSILAGYGIFIKLARGLKSRMK